jgi:hypothetical protein
MLTFCTNNNAVYFISVLFIICTSVHVKVAFCAAETCTDHMYLDQRLR